MLERIRKKAVHNLVGSSIPTDRDKTAITTSVTRAGDFGSLAGTGGFSDVDVESARAQAFEDRSHEFAAAPTTGSGIDYCEISLVHSATMASRPMPTFPISSARTVRLIFMEAVRGKSRSQSKYPPTRLKSGSLRLHAAICSCNAPLNS